MKIVKWFTVVMVLFTVGIPFLLVPTVAVTRGMQCFMNAALVVLGATTSALLMSSRVEALEKELRETQIELGGTRRITDPLLSAFKSLLMPGSKKEIWFVRGDELRVQPFAPSGPGPQTFNVIVTNVPRG
ncbi:MAG: hypothetical protein V1926_01595 [Candidatus Peregrinibacteria bacterium]